ncbi:MAG: hypothetical protein IK130_11415 [Oscillospiraceae bacterium]|nr:hypothetical protein [Oscillospiraceae bacterium]
MTDEQLASFRSLLEDFGTLAAIASEMKWAKTETKHFEFRIPNSLNAFFCISAIGFEKGFVRDHFEEAAVQVMIAAPTLYEEFDADKEWQDDEQRRDKLNNHLGVPVREYLEYKELELTEDSIDNMTGYICVNAIYDRSTCSYKDYALPQNALEMLSFFNDVKLYSIGEERCSGNGGRSWMALKDDTFLWVKYSGLSD